MHRQVVISKFDSDIATATLTMFRWQQFLSSKSSGLRRHLHHNSVPCDLMTYYQWLIIVAEWILKPNSGQQAALNAILLVLFREVHRPQYHITVVQLITEIQALRILVEDWMDTVEHYFSLTIARILSILGQRQPVRTWFQYLEKGLRPTTARHRLQYFCLGHVTCSQVSCVMV